MLFENAIPESDMNIYHDVSSAWHTQKETPTMLSFLDAIQLTPRTHHPSIIHGDHNHKIHTLSLDVVEKLNVSGKMTNRTAGSECVWDSKQYNLLVRELLTRVVLLGDTT